METTYKIQVRLGQAEFSAEGPEDSVKAAYKDFLAAAQNLTQQPAPEVERNQNGRQREVPESAEFVAMDRVYAVEDDVVILRLLPPEGPNRAADAAILLMYGFRKLKETRDVPVTKLNEALRKSGIALTRVDTVLSPRNNLFMKGGTRSGGRYSLNQLGVTTAEGWLRDWFH